MAVKKKQSNGPLVIAGLALLGLVLGLRQATAAPGNITGAFDQGSDQDEVKEALKQVANLYGRDYAEKVEQLLRLESAHFTSQQWKVGHTAGMEANTSTFPFGWSSLEQFIDAMPSLNLYPDNFTTYTMDENQTDDVEEYIAFPSAYDFVFFLAWFIKNKRNGRFGNWFSTNDASATQYENTMSTIDADLVNSF